jgi:hypothetical protein
MSLPFFIAYRRLEITISNCLLLFYKDSPTLRAERKLLWIGIRLEQNIYQQKQAIVN